MWHIPILITESLFNDFCDSVWVSVCVRWGWLDWEKLMGKMKMTYKMYLYLQSVHRKLISQYKKEMEIFIRIKLRIINWEQPLRDLWEQLHSLEVKVQLYGFFETEDCTLNDVLLTVCTIQVCKYKVVGHRDPYEVKKEYCLLRSCLDGDRRMLLFMVEQVFPPVGRTGRRCIMQIHNEQ